MELLGYQVLTTANGHEVQEVINNSKGLIVLLLSDMVIPDGMSGYELAENMCKKEMH